MNPQLEYYEKSYEGSCILHSSWIPHVDVELYDKDKIFSHFVHKISNFIIDKKVQIQNIEINYDVICNSV